MSRPRTPFGADRPGLMAATTIRVLAAEMSDPGRFARGKRYFSDRAVTDIVVGHGVVTAEVLGSRREPYVVTIETRAGDGVPSRADVTVRCTCPDDDGWGRSACKHAVAALLTLGDELTIEPELLPRWRRSDTVTTDDGTTDDGTTDDGTTDTVTTDDGTEHETEHEPEHGLMATDREHPLAALLGFPDGAALPPVPDLDDAVHPRFPDPLVAAVLDDALDALHLRWE